MPLNRRILSILALSAPLLAGCNTWQDRAEFAPPESRWRSTEPSPVPANAPPPPIAQQFCYRTLAAVDCYYEAKPERITGYTGTYPNPEAADPPAAPVKR